ncbi:MAG: hypothetical protein AABX93_00365 [Nanoarchaeota archaeon]
MRSDDDIALFDMDGTLCDFDKALFRDLEKMRSPFEEEYHPPIKDDAPSYIKERAEMIRSCKSWWANLPKFQFGWDVLDIAKKLDYEIMVLTQGPRRNPSSWSGKKLWIDKNLGKDVGITITRNKGLVYGKILVDDYPPYIDGWLKWRPRGLVIMPANKQNQNYSRTNVIRYDGKNLSEVYDAMSIAKERKSRESLKI